VTRFSGLAEIHLESPELGYVGYCPERLRIAVWAAQKILEKATVPV
jgi:hypothetical protein